MKKSTIVFVAVVMLLLSACGSKTPFSAQKPLENSALVYVYATSAMSSGENTSSKDFSIRINNKRYLERIKSGEYMAFNLKPESMTLSATRSQIEEQVLKLSLHSGEVYYLRIKDNLDGDKFEFEQVNSTIGAKEIAITGLAGSSEESPENIITEFVTPKEDKKEDMIVKPQPAPVAQTAPVAQPVVNTKSLSKSDEIEKAYNLKQKGILSEEEYKNLKTEILAK